MLAETTAFSTAGSTPGSATRRFVLGGLAAAAGLGAVATTGGAARAAYQPRSYPKTPVPGPLERHYLNRLGQGYTPASLRAMRNAGGPDAWLRRQLHPDQIQLPALVEDLPSWYPDLKRAPGDRLSLARSGGPGHSDYARDLVNLSMLRRIHSPREVFETMADFWSNHLHITSPDDLAWTWRTDYDRVIRTHALGTFTDLLTAASLHPSMLLYLDNFRSRLDAPNENQGRELLELHTVGHDGGYTEDMVKDSAVILSGWTVDYAGGTLEPFYDVENHTLGAVSVLGFSDANTARDGRALTKRYLSYLAHHPATARHLATKLAARLVRDVPPSALVDKAAQAYLDADTSITAMLLAIVDSTEFRDSAGAKVRTPIEDSVATLRALGPHPLPPRSKDSYANRITYTHGGDALYSWPRPDGAPDAAGAWASASRMLSSFRLHWVSASGNAPKEDVRWRSTASWIPERRMRYDVLVDHLARSVLGLRSTATMLQACCQLTGCTVDRVIDADFPHALMARTIATLLDTPAHLTR